MNPLYFLAPLSLALLSSVTTAQINMGLLGDSIIDDYLGGPTPITGEIQIWLPAALARF